MHQIDPADPSTLKIRTPQGENLKCLRCPSAVGADGVAAGWIDELWPTEGGGTIHVTICPHCRRRWSS